MARKKPLPVEAHVATARALLAGYHALSAVMETYPRSSRAGRAAWRVSRSLETLMSAHGDQTARDYDVNVYQPEVQG